MQLEVVLGYVFDLYGGSAGESAIPSVQWAGLVGLIVVHRLWGKYGCRAARFNGLAGADLGIGDSRGFCATPSGIKDTPSGTKDTPTFIPSLEQFSYCPTKATIMLLKYHTRRG